MGKPQEKLSLWSISILILSIGSLGLLALQTKASPELLIKLRIADYLICGLFFADFLYSIFTVRPLKRYLFTWGILDLLSCAPMAPALRFARLGRIFRLVRILRSASVSFKLANLFWNKREKNILLAVTTGGAAIIVFSVYAVLQVEPDMTLSDAIWWCLFLLITGDYGEYFPATIEGKILTATLMTAGVTVVGAFTATLASYFMHEDSEEDEERDNKILNEITELKYEVSELKELLSDFKTEHEK